MLKPMAVPAMPLRARMPDMNAARARRMSRPAACGCSPLRAEWQPPGDVPPPSRPTEVPGLPPEQPEPEPPSEQPPPRPEEVPERQPDELPSRESLRRIGG